MTTDTADVLPEDVLAEALAEHAADVNAEHGYQGS
jgi:hypothetical protein